MNDSYYEQLVTRKSRPKDFLIRFLVVFVIIAVAVFGFPFIGFLSVFTATVIGILAFYFIIPKLNVEYEYVLLNHDMDVDVIYSKQKRKHLLSFNILKAEIFAPAHSPRLKSYQTEKSYSYTSERKDATAYTIILPVGSEMCSITLELDETMLEQFQTWLGTKFYLD